MAKSKPGRPKGAKTRRRPTTTASPSRCPRCGSTDRGPYTHTTRQDYPGTTPAGEPFTAVVWRRTRCRNCGQHRTDRTYLNEPAPPRLPTMPAEIDETEK